MSKTQWRCLLSFYSYFIKLNRCVLLQSLRRIDWKEGGLSLAQAVTLEQSKEHTSWSLTLFHLVQSFRIRKIHEHLWKDLLLRYCNSPCPILAYRTQNEKTAVQFSMTNFCENLTHYYYFLHVGGWWVIGWVDVGWTAILCHVSLKDNFR